MKSWSLSLLGLGMVLTTFAGDTLVEQIAAQAKSQCAVTEATEAGYRGANECLLKYLTQLAGAYGKTSAELGFKASSSADLLGQMPVSAVADFLFRDVVMICNSTATLESPRARAIRAHQARAAVAGAFGDLGDTSAEPRANFDHLSDVPPGSQAEAFHQCLVDRLK